MTDRERLREAVDRELPRALEDLAALVAIPSVSKNTEHAEDVAASATAVADLVRGLGWSDVAIVSVPGGRPAVIAHWPAPAGMPTVCLYSHHDVQPTGDPDAWTSQPFTVTERNGRLYGRGVVDDKGGIAAHLAALRALDGKPPVGVKLFFEGEEEIGSPTMGAFLDTFGQELAADAFVLLDSGNWAVGRPAFTSSLRGLVDVVVEVATLDHALHSGQYGGPVPDATTTLCRLLGTLWTEDGSVAIAGLDTTEVADLGYDEARLRAEAGVLDGVQLLGTGTLEERLWGRPSVTVIGLDAPRVDAASNTLAATARAQVSLRIAPTQDPSAALAALKQHLLDHAPFGAHVSFSEESGAGGAQLRFDDPIAQTAVTALGDAWGVQPVFMGMGGSIPLAGDLMARYPESAVLLTGIVDPDSRMHGLDESVDLGDFKAAALAEALLLARLGGAE